MPLPVKPLSSLFLAGVVVTPTLLLGQSIYDFRRPTPVEPRSRISFSGQMLSGITARIQDLGTINYYVSDSAAEDVYNDGFIIRSTDSEAQTTSQFAFSMDNVTETEVTSGGEFVREFQLNRYRSESLGESAEKSINGSYGWEVTYDYFWGSRKDRWRLALRMGFAVSNLDFDNVSSVNGRFLVTTTTVKVGSGLISYVPGGSYNGGENEGDPSIDPENDLTTSPEHDVVEYVWNEDDRIVSAEVDTVFQSNGVLASARIGPLLALRLAYGFDVELSAGLLGVYYSTEISMYETLANLPLVSGIDSTSFGTETVFADESDFLYGFYAEGILRYNVTERVSFYGGMMYFSLQNPPESKVSDSTFAIEFETPVIASAGLSVFF